MTDQERGRRAGGVIAAPLIALTYDIQAALGRERARIGAAVGARGAGSG